MFDLISTVTNGFRMAVQLFCSLLVGVMMVVFVGLPLAIGGRPEALVPLGIGSLALVSAFKTMAALRRG